MIALLLASTLTFKVLGIDCAKCAPPVKKALASVPGVTSVRVDTKAQTATIEGKADPEKIHEALANAGFEAELPGEHRSDFAPLSAAELAKLDIATFDGRTKVDIARSLAPGKITIVDFYADWCGPCTVLERRLQRYMAAHPNIALRRVDIGKWNNAAARQATSFGAKALPYVRVYAPSGKFVEAVTGGMWDEMLDAIERSSNSE
jgi:copper chaperone CopZ